MSFQWKQTQGIKYIKLDIGALGAIEYLKVDMEKVDFKGKNVPCTIEKENILEEEIMIGNKKVIFSSVLMGVPHTTIFVEDFDEYDANETGSLMEKADIFPEKTNVNFAKVTADDTIMDKKHGSEELEEHLDVEQDAVLQQLLHINWGK